MNSCQLSTQLQRHFLSLPCKASFNCQPSTELTHSPTKYFASLHFTSLHCTEPAWLPRYSTANIASNCPSVVVMSGCLAIDWTRVYRPLPSNARFFSRLLHSNGTARCSVVLYTLLGCSVLAFLECRISLVVQSCKAYLWSQASYLCSFYFLGVSLVHTKLFTAVTQSPLWKQFSVFVISSLLLYTSQREF
jgi:hypothetical protein